MCKSANLWQNEIIIHVGGKKAEGRSKRTNNNNKNFRYFVAIFFFFFFFFCLGESLETKMKNKNGSGQICHKKGGGDVDRSRLVLAESITPMINS